MTKQEQIWKLIKDMTWFDFSDLLMKLIVKKKFGSKDHSNKSTGLATLAKIDRLLGILEGMRDAYKKGHARNHN